MHPFMDLQGLTPRPGRLKCVWIPGADGRPESIWVPDWEHDGENTAGRSEEPAPLRKAG